MQAMRSHWKVLRDGKNWIVSLEQTQAMLGTVFKKTEHLEQLVDALLAEQLYDPLLAGQFDDLPLAEQLDDPPLA